MPQPVTRRPVRFATAILLCISMQMSSVASAVPSALETKKAEAAAAQRELEDLQAQLEMRAEEYAAVSEELERTRGEVALARRRFEEAERRLKAARRQLEDRAAGIYRSGGVELIEVLLGTTSFADFLSRMDWLQRVGRNDAALVEEVKAARASARTAQESLERRESEQVVLRGQASIKQEEVARALSSQRTYLDGIEAQVAELVRQEEERQRQLAEAAARAAAVEAARRAAPPSSSTGADPPGDGDGGGTSPTPAGLGEGHPEVVSIAMQYVGVVDYVYGGSSPESGFDCSGLTRYCYGQIGVNLPRTSRDQSRTGTRIPADRTDLLRAGDLVFFGYDGDPNRVHHVGIYVGGGQYVHAPQTGQKVSVSSLDARIESRSDYVGASRL